MSVGEINWSNWNDAYGWMPEQWCCMGTRNWLAIHAHNRRGGPMRDKRTEGPSADEWDYVHTLAYYPEDAEVDCYGRSVPLRMTIDKAARIALPSNGEAEKSDSASDDSPGHA